MSPNDHQRINRLVVSNIDPPAWNFLPVAKVWIETTYLVGANVTWLDQIRFGMKVDESRIPPALTPEDNRRVLLLNTENTKQAFLWLAYQFRELTELYRHPVVVPFGQFGEIKGMMQNLLTCAGFRIQDQATFSGTKPADIATLFPLKLPYDVVHLGSPAYYDMYEENLRHIKSELYKEHPHIPTEEERRWSNFDRKFLDSLRTDYQLSNLEQELQAQRQVAAYQQAYPASLKEHQAARREWERSRGKPTPINFESSREHTVPPIFATDEEADAVADALLKERKHLFDTFREDGD